MPIYSLAVMIMVENSMAGDFKSYYVNDFGVEDISTTSRNPASNDIYERIHQTVGNALRTLTHTYITPWNIS